MTTIEQNNYETDDDGNPPWHTWHPFSIHCEGGLMVYDPNKWTFERSNGCAGIYAEDGKLIDEPPDTGQCDAALIRHGIIWVLMGTREDSVDVCWEGYEEPGHG